VDNSPVKHFLLKFDVTGVNGQTITNAKIRLYNTDAASEGGDFYHVSDDSWQPLFSPYSIINPLIKVRLIKCNDFDKFS